MNEREKSGVVSRQEAVQPSLWDRLLNDLPGLTAEIDTLAAELKGRLGSSVGVSELLANGARALERRDDLDDEARSLAHRIIGLQARRKVLEDRGIMVTSQVLREAVRRDVEMLFNTERLEADFLLTDSERLERKSAADQLTAFPEVRRSVLNYGVPAFSGRNGSDFDQTELSRELKTVLNNFEPRLKRDSVKVQVSKSEKAGLVIVIEGTLLLSPVPERLRLSTTIDLDNGNARTSLEDL